MSKTLYLPYFSRRLERIASGFVARSGLPTILGILPSRLITKLYPLTTVIELWNYFLSIDELLPRKKLLDAMLANKPILEVSSLLPIKIGDTLVHPDQAPPRLAKCLNLPIERFILSVLIYQDLIFLSDTKGLSIINAPPTWLLELNPAMKKARSLKKNGFSFQTETVYYPSNSNLVATPPTVSIFSCKARVWSDWVILWEYFAGKGNTKALALLRYLAIQGLEHRIEPLLLVEN